MKGADGHGACWHSAQAPSQGWPPTAHTRSVPAAAPWLLQPPAQHSQLPHLLSAIGHVKQCDIWASAVAHSLATSTAPDPLSKTPLRSIGLLAHINGSTIGSLMQSCSPLMYYYDNQKYQTPGILSFPAAAFSRRRTSLCSALVSRTACPQICICDNHIILFLFLTTSLVLKQALNQTPGFNTRHSVQYQIVFM